MDETARDPRAPERVIGFGGDHYPTPAELRAELPEDLRARFEEEYVRVLDHAKATGDLAPLAEMLPQWQVTLYHRRLPDWPEMAEAIRRINAGLPVDTVPALPPEWDE
ncbi:DUF6247 family protein (plasmid) [Embleya sp. NBC_00888]|uniref:DUF6247 family protein n=1 Tax=Embleya sp. NBC_00888 TaxID=2975960 RepID=UPI002F914484|nr:DUF6247 family protein [Embleya sp. NBC_00888]